MSKWAIVEKNAVVDVASEVPINWRNVSNLNALSQEQLKQFGWFPLVDVAPKKYDPKSRDFRKDDVKFTVLADHVEMTYILTPRPSAK